MNYTKQEKVIYTFVICLVMEFVMALYNYFFHTDAFLDEAFLLALYEFIPAFVVGFLCEWCIVSNVAKKLAYYLHTKHCKDQSIIHINELCIAIGMMLVISMFGAIYHADHESVLSFLLLVGTDFIKNAVVGIPLFMLVISPLARKIVHYFYPLEKEDVLLS